MYVITEMRTQYICSMVEFVISCFQKFPEPVPKYDNLSPGKPCHRENSCSGYRDYKPLCHHLCNQGFGCSLFSPFAALPSFGYPVMIMPAFAPMGFYGQCMTNMNGQFADCYQGRCQNVNGCCHHQNPPPCCPFDETNARNHHNESHDLCNDVRHHCHGEPTGEHTSGNHHHHSQDGCCENQDPRNMKNYNCEQHVNDDDGYDDAKSVEELLEEYLEDIDEKTERIHDILDDYEAMDLFISVHGFQPEEVHVTARGRILTIKGDHQYSEAMWVRVRNFSESYEIPEEFDVSRTTAVITGDSLCVRIPHVDGE